MTVHYVFFFESSSKKSLLSGNIYSKIYIQNDRKIRKHSTRKRRSSDAIFSTMADNPEVMNRIWVQHDPDMHTLGTREWKGDNPVPSAADRPINKKAEEKNKDLQEKAIK